jgi:hypothetical protein
MVLPRDMFVGSAQSQVADAAPAQMDRIGAACGDGSGHLAAAQ